jgi:DNA-binding transcriptional LysR family regulator
VVGRGGGDGVKFLESRLTLRNLRLVDAVIREGNLVRAAQSLNMTQSAATKALQEIEAISGVELFERTNRGTLPTAYGQTLATHAKIILSQLRHAEQALSDLKDGTGGRVAVGTLLSAAVELLPSAIAKVLEIRPRLMVKIVEGTDDVLMPLLRLGELDFVLGRLPEYREREGLLQEVLMDDYAQIVARADHPLFQIGQLELGMLREWPWILPRQETTLRRQIDETFRREGLEPPNCGVESISLLANRSLLRSTQYLAVWPVQLAQAEARSGQISVLPIDLPATARPIGLSVRAEGRLSPAAEVLIEALRAIAKSTHSGRAGEGR